MIKIGCSYSYCQLGKRGNQEDSLFQPAQNSEHRIFIVCDGVGGTENGEKASSAVCRLLSKELQQYVDSKTQINKNVIRNAVKNVINCFPEEDMGDAATTMTLLVVNDNELLAAHIGDSRIYQFRKNECVVFRTRDHSLVADMVEAGLLTEDEARVHPRSNIITRALRTLKDGEVMPETDVDCIRDVCTGDVILLCSDGVTENLADKEIADILTDDSKDLEKRVAILAEKTAGNRDNNTAIAIEIESGNTVKGDAKNRKGLLRRIVHFLVRK